VRGADGQKPMDESNRWDGVPRGTTRSLTIGWKPSCDCEAETVPCVVLDPFAGSGTSLQVARHLGRRGIGCELNPDYGELAIERINTPLKPPKQKKPKRQMVWNQKPLF